MREDITGAVGVPDRNQRRVVYSFAERGLHIGNTYFRGKHISKYNMVARDRDGMKIKVRL